MRNSRRVVRESAVLLTGVWTIMFEELTLDPLQKTESDGDSMIQRRIGGYCPRLVATSPLNPPGESSGIRRIPRRIDVRGDLSATKPPDPIVV